MKGDELKLVFVAAQRHCCFAHFQATRMGRGGKVIKHSRALKSTFSQAPLIQHGASDVNLGHFFKWLVRVKIGVFENLSSGPLDTFFIELEANKRISI